MVFLKLIRYKNLLMVLLTMVLAKYAVLDYFNIYHLSNLAFVYLSFLVLLITSSGYIINDIFDIESDVINKPQKVFISKQISKKTSWILYGSFTFLACILSVLFSTKPIHYIIFFGSQILLFFYSLYFKKFFFIGNLIVAVLVALPIYTILLLDFIPIQLHFYPFEYYIKDSFIFYMFFAFLSTLIREIIKDIEDLNGDLKISAKTLPIVIGIKRASRIAFFFSVVLVIFLIFVLKLIENLHLFFYYGIFFLLLPLCYFLYYLWIAKNKKDFSKLSSLLKVIMFLGIVSMIFFKWID
jgi:4-hydroxybenzoate polyprenyltransferase